MYIIRPMIAANPNTFCFFSTLSLGSEGSEGHLHRIEFFYDERVPPACFCVPKTSFETAIHEKVYDSVNDIFLGGSLETTQPFSKINLK